ncbi:MAG: hypothetical protein AB7T06_47490 [Kofleriaceae bacterium]
MSIVRTTMLVLALASCTKVPGTESVDDRGHGKQGVIAPAPANATVTLMSVTFANNCGGAPPANPPARAAKAAIEAPSAVPAQDSVRPGDEAARYRCEQTSMQLSIASKTDATVAIKSVEVFDEKGASLGTLDATKPTRWSDGAAAYETWNEKVDANQTASVSYVLSQPTFVNRYDSHDRMYTVKVIASVGGVTQQLTSTVMVVAQPAPMPT